MMKFAITFGTTIAFTSNTKRLFIKYEVRYLPIVNRDKFGQC